MTRKKYEGAWSLGDLAEVPQNGLKVFSTFACGGGSSMGYKLAGFDMVGANDIDPQMQRHYEKNLNPKLFIAGKIKDMLQKELPSPLYELDVLDGSPPCSSFSLAGKRDKTWGKETYFREGQAVQVLDDLFFDFLKVADKLKPKTIIAENVRGMLFSSAKGYLEMIVSTLRRMDYTPQVFLVNAAYCGVPQKRERVFIAAVRNDQKKQRLKIEYEKKIITCKQATADIRPTKEELGAAKLSPAFEQAWQYSLPGSNFALAREKIAGKKNNMFNGFRLNGDGPANTLVATHASATHWSEPRHLTFMEYKRLGSFPDDYWAESESVGKYLVGMSVPPFMMRKVAESVRDQWLLT